VREQHRRAGVEVRGDLVAEERGLGAVAPFTASATLRTGSPASSAARREVLSGFSPTTTSTPESARFNA
jgi:hypothetical protein